ncbi:MAG: SAM-dependent methyltransferase [Lachnospiraceae bacterium]|nr:SAM-dependent methyltransferase [Lachnospiraceae bacterium]
MVKDKLEFQQTVYKGAQVFHSNHSKSEMIEEIIGLLALEEQGDKEPETGVAQQEARQPEGRQQEAQQVAGAATGQVFRQLECESMDGRLTVLVSKKGKATIKCQKKKQAEEKQPMLTHNRSKKYVLEEGKPVPFLVELGVQTPEGKIVRSRYDKFRQINRYLEFVEDILPSLKKEGPVHVIDFGCGKSYLTFALYYYLHEIKGIDVTITGLDLKEDVIDNCNRLAEKYGYEGLRFYKGDISTFEGCDRVDMVVTLHACDTATDYAIQKAIDWKARVIFTVPCCQHEVNKQIQSELLSPVLKYGLLKERIAALLTDGIRAELLTQAGYDTQVLEFIDMEHTPKNILIRAVKRGEKNPAGEDAALEQMTEQLHIETTLQKLRRV